MYDLKTTTAGSMAGSTAELGPNANEVPAPPPRQWELAFNEVRHMARENRDLVNRLRENMDPCLRPMKDGNVEKETVVSGDTPMLQSFAEVLSVLVSTNRQLRCLLDQSIL